jgi:ATP-binding cassette subfamily B protein
MNAKNILAFGRKNWAAAEFKSSFDIHFRDAIKSQTLAFFVPEFFKTLSILTAVFALLYSLFQGESITLLVVTLAVFIRLLPKIANVTEAYSMIKDATPSIIQYSKLFPEVVEKNQSNKIKIDNFSSSLSFDDVSFSYPTRKGVIKNLNFEIKKNSFVSLVGSSGSGKTTCADLLMGLYSPEKGSIMVDGCSLDSIDLDSYLDRVGYVQQDSVLLDGSIRKNLLWANPAASENDMWESLKLVSIDNFVKSLPKGLDNLVGDRGVSISGGQKQRIALALALIRKPDILILDEATSSLDYESEKIIRNSLKSLSHKLTIISVTHRPSMAEHSDMIYVFEKGSIIDFGVYKDLKNKKLTFFNKISEESE